MSLAEDLIKQRYEDNGWETFRNGWPDFAFYRNGEIVFVEVKGPTDALSKKQLEMHTLLRALGIEVRVEHVSRAEVEDLRVEREIIALERLALKQHPPG